MPQAAESLPIRRATPDDGEAAAHIVSTALAEYGISFEPEGRDADVATFGARPENDDFVVVGPGGGPIGIASVGPQGKPGVAWLSKLFVAREARGRGAGRALLEAAHAAARARGFQHVGLRTRRVFREAIALYEASGYRLDPLCPPESNDLVYYRAL